jgi:hypothetical protein
MRGISVAAVFPSGRAASPSRRSSAELAGPPAPHDIAHVIGIDAWMDDREQVDQRLQVWRQRDDLPDVQVARRPAIESPADALRERVIDI